MGRTIGLWVLLIVVFLIAYQLFAPTTPDPARTARMMTWFPTFIVAVFVVFFVVFFAFNLMRAKSANRDLLEGVSLLNQGRFVEALATFDRSAKKARRANGIAYSRGLALLSLWRIAQAEQAFTTAAGLKAFGAPDIRKLLVPYRALTGALLGETGVAAAHLTETDGIGAGSDPQATLARVVLKVRAGDWAKGHELAQRFEVKQLGGTLRALADALDAWCVEQLGGEKRPVDPVALLGETGLDEVKKTWPELAEFVARAQGSKGAAPS